MNAAEARKMAGLLQPRQVIPIHFEGWSHFSEGQEALEPRFRGASAHLRFLSPGHREPIELPGL